MARAKRGFGTVRKQRSGRYQAQYTGPDGVRYPLGTYGTARQADAALSKVRVAIDYGTWVSPAEQARLDAEAEAAAEAHRLTVAEYAEQWIPTLKSHSHRHNSASRFRLHINPVLGDTALADLTRELCDSWYRGCCPKYPTQRARCYENLRAMLNDAVDRGLIGTNPLRIKGASTVSAARKPQTASLEQLTALMDAMPEQDRAGILIAAWCGLRAGEVTALQRQDAATDPAASVPKAPTVRLWIRRHLVQNRGRSAGEPSLLIVTGSKASGIEEAVVVPPHIVPELWEHLDRFVAEHPRAWLFPSRTDPEAPLHPSTLDNAWQKAKRSAGLAQFTYHDLRRTGMTITAESGATLAEMMARLRHRTITAAQRYIVQAQGADVRVAERISAKAAPVARPAAPPRPVAAAIDPVEAEVQRRVQERLRELGIEE
ncbi:tyrosine-type recombinase/integrase [Tsukamurella spumae]|uniref:Tyrosine-type recombinase/integrase n=1 Tax=Tsukamurella spumae TaxID=44753 RepID=A0A846WWY9_9ACTN|nr:site-specific integrase [Tsukamurella spumae]NKY16785.1 tyrosine-type recombinase/integrase [Tsukamurella spumae]